ncbi:MAG: glycosyltransferase family 39 protein [Chitinophagales bacterium]
MVFYSSEVNFALIAAALPALASLYVFFFKKNHKLALFLLGLSGLMLRFAIASFDPYLQEWDERYHALVAKNLMDFPFRPMLRIDPILEYQKDAWCCNHIWVHKQPLFMWQMAVSMKIFGVNEIAMRLPSVIMGTLSIFMIFEIAKFWTKDGTVAYLSSFLFTFSYYQLELTSGRFSLDQNDAAFAFYVTASIWAFVKYLKTNYSIKWVVIVGMLVGGAVLNKWLTGLLIFGGWGLYILLSEGWIKDYRKWLHLLLAFFVSLVVFMPWQIYILHAFPEESAIMYEHNRRHIFEPLDGHIGDIWFHFNQMKVTYGRFLLIFIPLGIIQLFRDKKVSKSLTISFVSMGIIIYLFFSAIVQTKMPAFTFPVHSLIWTMIAFGIYSVSELVFNKLAIYQKYFLYVFLYVCMGIYTLKPWEIAKYRDVHNEMRNTKIYNTAIYKNLSKEKIEGRVILNCKAFEDTDVMFYQDVNAYHWYPEQHTLDSLLEIGYQFAAFQNHTNQGLPEYISNNKDILIIREQIK